MRAAVVIAPGETPGFADHPTPEPGLGEVLVRVSAAPVVPLDLLCASGTSYFGAPQTPYVPGVQGVGWDARTGDLVWFATTAGMAAGDGSLAEWCVVPQHDVVPLPLDTPQLLAAAVGLSGVAAWMALSWRAGLSAGERVLILGGGGAVGQAGIGAAKVLGASLVVAVARTPSLQRARDAGADVVVAADAGPGELTARLTELGPFDVVLDPVWGATAGAALHALGQGGRLVNLGSAGGEHAPVSSSALRSRSLDVRGYTNNALTPDQRAQALTRVLRHARAGEITVAHQRAPLAEVDRAWRDTASGSGTRWVLTPEG